MTFPRALSGAADPVTVTTLTSVDSPYTVLAADEYIACDCTGGAITVIPPAIGVTGRRLHVVKIDATANAVTLDPVAGATINGALTQVLNARYQSITAWDTGAEWSVE